MNIPRRKEFSVFLLLLPLPLGGLRSLYRPLWEADSLDSVFPLSILLGTLLWGILGWLMIAISLYFSRTITLDEEGCCYCIWKFRRKFKWEELTVQYCENSNPVLGFSSRLFPLHGPGILISRKGRTYSEFWEAGAFCLLFHPMTSVFLLFAPPTGGRWRSSRNPVYAVDREALRAALKSFGQWPSIADD